MVLKCVLHLPFGQVFQPEMHLLPLFQKFSHLQQEVVALTLVTMRHEFRTDIFQK